MEKKEYRSDWRYNAIAQCIKEGITSTSQIAEELGVSQSYAYKLVRQLNKELAETGCIIIPGRIDRKFFHEKLYGTRNQN